MQSVRCDEPSVRQMSICSSGSSISLSGASIFGRGAKTLTHLPRAFLRNPGFIQKTSC